MNGNARFDQLVKIQNLQRAKELVAMYEGHLADPTIDEKGREFCERSVAVFKEQVEECKWALKMWTM